MDVPKLVCDVTVPVCYALDHLGSEQNGGKVGLSLSGSKSSIVGFFNPIPPSLAVEHANPTLCIVYKLKSSSKPDKVLVDYYSERQKVQILV